ncbi:MAG TPA: universal stress protein [Telluria sp.]|nr:universal stress protein [Telluria sp.]
MTGGPEPEPASDRCRRLLVPVKQLGDVDAALAYVARAYGAAPVRLLLLHVKSPPSALPLLDMPAQHAMATEEGAAGALLAQAGRQCEARALQHSGFILSGDVAFSILDAAESLDCDEIVMTRHGDWMHRLFSSETVRKVERMRRHVPLVLVDADGAPQGEEAGA